jgi:hypothetical protein
MTRITTTVSAVAACLLLGAAHASLSTPLEAPGAPLTAQAASLAQVSNPGPTPSHVPSTAQQGALPACEVEDGSSGPIPCRWQADVAGNGLGSSFTITAPNVYVYDDGHTEVVHEDGDVAVYGTETGYALPKHPKHGETVCLGAPGAEGSECATWDKRAKDWINERPYEASDEATPDTGTEGEGYGP